MPPKLRSRRDDRAGSESDTDTDVDANATVVGVPSSPNVTMSEQMLQTLISNITRSQVEANRLLVESILSGNQHFATPSPRLDTPSHQQRAGNFAKCTARFDGRSKDADQLEAFIDAIEVYRECTNVSEEHALRGLPMLLVGDAAVWWQGVKSTVSSWSDALHRLRGMYGVPRPAYKIFRDVFALEQGHERADVFVSKVRAMLSKLPYVVPEEMKLDIVYGLLDRRIRKRVPRDAVDGLEVLMTKVRLVEESLAEVSNISNTNRANPFDYRLTADPSVNPLRSHNRATSHNVNPSAAPFDNNTRSQKSRDRFFVEPNTVVEVNDPHSLFTKPTDSAGQQRVRPKCVYCKLFGHTVDNCHRKSNKVDSSINIAGSDAEVRCYGCGQLGVMRSKCSNCRVEPGSSGNKPEFSSAQVVDNDDARPMVNIGVAGRKGVAILDTGATHSIAGPSLYKLLVDAGIHFRECLRTVGLADGTQQPRTTLECDTDVLLQGRVIPTTFMVFPDAQTRTLLGRDFITRAGILLDLPQNSWCFSAQPHTWHPFITSSEIPTSSKTGLAPIEVTGLRIIEDESTNLRTNPRMQLDTFQVHAHQDLVISPPSRTPLSKSRKKRRKRMRIAQEQSVLGRAKQQLVSPPVLRQAGEMSSGYCRGAVLKQGEGPDERPVQVAPGRRNVIATPSRSTKDDRLETPDDPFRGRCGLCKERRLAFAYFPGDHFSQLTSFAGDVPASPPLRRSWYFD